MLLLLGALLARVGFLQIVRGGKYDARARKMHFSALCIPATRGRILDRHGRPLAVSYHSRSIAADPQVIENPDLFATRLAFALNDPGAAPAFAARIREQKARGKRFVYLRRRVDRDLSEQVARSRVRGLILQEEPRREYPQGSGAAAVLGAVGHDPRGRIQGLTGLEARFDGLLQGRDGHCEIFRSGLREQLHLFPETKVEAQPGADLVTTLDAAVQQIVEAGLDRLVERHHPKTACAVALDPFTGEVLALAGRPSLDVEAFPGVAKESLRIPSVHCPYELGSTLKPLILAWALTRGAVHPGQILDCGPGVRVFGHRRLRDVHAYGRIDLETVIVKSSNIGMAQVALALGVEETRAYLHLLGFGARTGIEIAGEEPGWVTPDAKWSETYTLISVGMGRELLVTPLQLARAYAALINGGDLLRPTLLRDQPRTLERRIPFDAEAVAFVKRAMERVVSAQGTGRRARVNGLRVAGKTGSSEKYDRPGHFVSSFLGYAPADDPRLLVLVVADDPKSYQGIRPYGGVVAAPVVGEILRRALPLLPSHQLSSTLPESGVRLSSRDSRGKVRNAAVYRSGVWTGETDSPVAIGRNPDSVGEEVCRSGRG